MTAIDSTYDPLAWGSHLPPLFACLAASSGPVLEVGVGHFSTPILHAYCMAAYRNLFSVEDHAEWYSEFRTKYQRSGHEFITGDYSVVVPEMAKLKWGVAFIDNSPGGKRRADDFTSLISSADFVVVHDYHGENEEAIQPLITVGHILWKVFGDYSPPTLVASRHKTPPF